MLVSVLIDRRSCATGSEETMTMIDRYLDQLTASARAIIAAGYWTKPTAALRHAHQETEFVATLIDSCVGPLTVAWGNILQNSGLDLTIRGAFLHQRPKIRFPSPTITACGEGHCELADLLIVHDHEDSARRACLIQAKTDPGDPVMGAQKDLYERWEPFRFAAGPKSAKGQVYSVMPNDEGCRYGVVRLPPPANEEPWLAEQPLGTRGPVDMGLLLAEMLAATLAQRPTPARTAVIGGSNDWSILIDDLLAASLTSNYPLTGFWPVRRPRLSSQRLPIMAWVETSHDGWEAIASTADVSTFRSSGPEKPARAAEEGPDGISVIHIRTTETGERKSRIVG